MKFVISLTILACYFASCSLACDPNGNNKPTCTSGCVNEPVRNFWDPTGYWLCESATGEATMVRCPQAQLFDAVEGECVWWNEWTWINPCDEY
ncbi:uncharacterized protein [Musca autumnalis]|uniref:uncharacterized protein n=1 Tax=Musca autumnalis TaxID=221902 RepID=UPI003CE817A0